MKVEFLGSGGAITTPQPGCRCRVCVEARQSGAPYSRTGPSVFVHGPDLLIDSPEEIKFQLNRAGLGPVPACTYSHWHPDHVMGRRVWEMNKDWRGWPPHDRQSDIYLPQQVAADFRERLGSWENFEFLAAQNLVRLHVLQDGEAFTLGKTRVLPVRLAADYVYAFLLEEEGTRVLIAPDELVGWDPPQAVCGLDLAVLPMGVPEFDPFTGERAVPAEHPVLQVEATWADTLEIARKLQAKRVVMTHIEEPFGLSHDDLQRLAAKLQADGSNIDFAYDTLQVEA
jgi:phosphoribosyl 1,2-cyclic phosphate phosphodiesterase